MTKGFVIGTCLACISLIILIALNSCGYSCPDGYEDKYDRGICTEKEK